MSVNYLILAWFIWIVISFLPARKTSVQRFFLGEKDFGKEKEETIEKMKQIAEKILQDPKMPFEESKDYIISLSFYEEKLIRVSVETWKARVTATEKKKTSVEPKCRTRANAIYTTTMWLIITGVLLISLVFLLINKFILGNLVT